MANEPITIIGEANFRNQLRRFGIKEDDRRRHMYIIGKTGMGKSVLLQNLAISDIHAGHGICFIDPHGDPAEELLEFIPPHRINDVVYINPSDLDFPVAFNILESIDPKYKHLVASGLVAVFKKMWADSWGPRLEYILRNTILALLDFPSSTLLGVTRMLTDKQYRRKVVAKITDPVVKSFWVGEFENYNDRFMTEAISPIQNKVGQFLSSAVIRNIVGQVKSTIDLNDAMDNQKIVILNLSKGKLGEDNSALLGAMMITKIQLAAMQRASIPEHERKDFYLYVDEFQNFATEAFATILSEARKYRLNLIVANQYIAQMQETVSDAVFGNVGTMVCFRIGAADAEVFEKEFEPTFMMHDLVNLPKYNIYLKLMVDGVASRAFSAQTLPIIYEKFSLQDRVIQVSRERYANPRAEVEEKIMRWSGVQVVPATMSMAEVAENAVMEMGDEAVPETAAPQGFGSPQYAQNDRPREGRSPESGDRPRRDSRPRDGGERREYRDRPPRDRNRDGDRDRDRDRRSDQNRGRDRRDQRPRDGGAARSRAPRSTDMQRVSREAPRAASSAPASSPAQAPRPTPKPASAPTPPPVPPKLPEPQKPPEHTPPEEKHVDTTPVEQPTPPNAVPKPEAQEPMAPAPVRVILPEELEQQRKAAAKRKPGKKPVDPNRPLYKTQCDDCGIPIEVPFKPDGSRPVLCQDCLPEYRSRMAKMEQQQQDERSGGSPARGSGGNRGARIAPGQTVRF